MLNMMRTLILPESDWKSRNFDDIVDMVVFRGLVLNMLTNAPNNFMKR